jgi:hypothetical protein
MKVPHIPSPARKNVAFRSYDNLVLSTLLIASFALMLSSFFSSPAAGDTGVGISFMQPEITINTSSIGFVDIVVSNNGDTSDTFNVVVWPPEQGGVTQNIDRYNLRIGPHSNETTRMYITVSNDADEQNKQFLVTVKSVTFDGVMASAYYVVGVMRTSSVYISELSTARNMIGPGECVNITSGITNTGTLPVTYKLQTVIQRGPETVHKFEDRLVTIPGGSVKDVDESLCFGKYALAGEYMVTSTLRTSLNKFVDRPSLRFNISTYHDLVYNKSVEYTPFAQIRTVTVKNEGNAVERDFFVTETVSSLAARLFFPITNVDSTDYQGGNVVYGWKVSDLEPGRETTIRYEIRYVSIWITGVVIALIVILAFSYAYKPRLNKKVTVKGEVRKGSDVPVTLEVKNSTLYEIRNISITDNIPPLATLVEKFDTLPPQIKKTETGTELSWKIKTLRPLEERVLTYRIRPTVELAGVLRLPRAFLEYLDSKNVKKTESSGTVELR